MLCKKDYTIQEQYETNGFARVPQVFKVAKVNDCLQKSSPGGSGYQETSACWKFVLSKSLN